jgi:type IV pilus assembly protein PilM
MLFGSKNLLGLDIGTSAIKLVAMEETKGAYKLNNFGIAKLPKETIVNGVIIHSEPIINSIKALLSNLKIDNKNTAISVSGHPVIIKKITLPIMSEEELEANIEAEAEQYIPFDLDEVNIDFQILGVAPEQTDQMNVLLVAAKKQLVEEYSDILKAAGLKPLIADIDVFALGNMFNLNYSFDENAIVALVDIGASITNINIIRNETSVFNRDIFLGGNQITENIQKNLSVSFEEAEELKTGTIIEGISQDVIAEQIQKGSLLIAREIKRALDFYTGSSYTEITHIFLSGGGSKTKNLKETIKEGTNAEVEFTDPFKTIKYDKKTFDTEYIKKISLLSSISVGLAIRKFGD